jgi:hypothetical protein
MCIMAPAHGSYSPAQQAFGYTLSFIRKYLSTGAITITVAVVVIIIVVFHDPLTPPHSWPSEHYHRIRHTKK